MLKLIRSLYTFYLNHFFAGLCISLTSCWMYDSFGNSALTILFWYKVATMGIFYYAISQRKKREFLYYQNLGISKKMLYIITFGIDFILFIILMIATSKFL